jgi:hypothetical protein
VTMALLDFFKISTLIIPCSFLWIWKNGIGLSYIFKGRFCFSLSFWFWIWVLVRMPYKSLLSICFLYFIVVCFFAYTKYFIVVFPFWFFELEFSMFKFLPNTYECWILLLYCFIVSASLIKLFSS